MNPFLDRAIDEWSQPPVAGRNMSPLVVLPLADEQFWNWARRTEREHWAQARAGSIRDLMGLDACKDKRVLDWGCGFGMDALALARGGAAVTLADIQPLNLAVARRVLKTHGYAPADWLLCSDGFMPERLPAFDVVSCNGVMHHDPDPQGLLNYLATAGGEIRLMLYSDKSWEWATKTALPEGPVTESPHFQLYVRTMDARGVYSEPYSEARCAELAKGAGLTLKSYTYVQPDDVYCVAVMNA